jgi:hypothetical protein
MASGRAAAATAGLSDLVLSAWRLTFGVAGRGAAAGAAAVTGRCRALDALDLDGLGHGDVSVLAQLAGAQQLVAVVLATVGFLV